MEEQDELFLKWDQDQHKLGATKRDLEMEGATVPFVWTEVRLWRTLFRF
jgi:hypothetical protein